MLLLGALSPRPQDALRARRRCVRHGPAPAPTRAGTPSADDVRAGRNVYAAAGAGALTGAARTARPLVYVPNTLSNTVQVIDPRTYRVIARYPTGREPQHVVPSPGT